ncbi:MAG: metallophosphoesterase family protein [Coprobacillus sp.]|nr:metallophosphoesterase family protein [Coprobacillus sp.]
MKILVLSDSHCFNENLKRIITKYKNQIDIFIHCGDSSLPIHDPLLTSFNIVVKGNHDIDNFPHYIKYHNICITHGHLYNVYAGYDELIQLCKKLDCHICFHGHTHVPTYQIHHNIHFINPGSIMMNRGTYGYGTYAIITLTNHHLSVKFYNSENDSLCNQNILEEGLELLEEFKKYV